MRSSATLVQASGDSTGGRAHILRKHATTVEVASCQSMGPGLQRHLTSPRRLYTGLHLSRELELKTRESCLPGMSARNEGQNGPSAKDADRGCSGTTDPQADR